MRGGVAAGVGSVELIGKWFNFDIFFAEKMTAAETHL
jgi:hypothetical protein